MKNFDSIDLFRAMGVCFVLLYHSVYIFDFNGGIQTSPYIYLITALMWSGVNLFFLASGFINGKQFLILNSTSSYAIRRVKRIFPLYYTYLLIGTLLFIYKFDFFYLNNYNILQQYFFLSGVDFYNKGINHPLYFCITWSLSVEVQLYIITFIIIRFGKKSSLKLCTFLMLIGCVTPYFHANHFGLLMHLDEYFLGVIIRYLYNKGNLSYKFTKLIFVTILIISVFTIPYIDLNQGNPLLDSLLLIIYSCILILLINFNFKIHYSILEIGKNCYFLYLFHMLFIYLFLEFFNDIGFPPIISLSITFFICYIASVLSKHTFESKFYKIA